MRLNPSLSGHQAQTHATSPVLVLLAAAAVLAAIAFLPGPVIFLAVLGCAVALAVNLAELRRDCGPGLVPLKH